MARFFIDRPIFAWVVAILMMLAGALSITGVMGSVFGTDSVQHHRGHNHVTVADLVALLAGCTDGDGTNGADVVDALAALIERNGGTL